MGDIFGIASAAAPFVNAGLGLALQGGQDRRQIRQGWKLQNMQLQGYGQGLEMQAQKEYEMWLKTNYGAQMEQMKKAGLNPALMYGMGGGGGATMGGGGGMPGGGAGGAQSNAGEIVGAAGMGIQTAAQVALLKAQKENIEADTAQKESTVPVNNANAEGMNQRNALTAYLMSVDNEGKTVDGDMNKSVRAQNEILGNKRNEAETRFKLDENERQKLMNSKVMEEIGQKISLMATQGMKEAEIYKNLQKEGKLLDAEIEWNALDIESGNVGKFLSNAIRMALKPR